MKNYLPSLSEQTLISSSYCAQLIKQRWRINFKCFLNLMRRSNRLEETLMGGMWAWSLDNLLAVSNLLCPGFSCLGSRLMWSWMSAVYRLNAWKDEYKHVFSDAYKPFCTLRCWCRRVTLRVINPTMLNMLPHKATKSTRSARIWSVSPVCAAQWVRERKREADNL